MQILFGTNLDGVIWSTKEAALGEVRIGPGGLLGLLETRLGITKPSIHPVHRIDEYMECMEALKDDSAWYAGSFSVDGWSTARQLLKWRDELVEAGWNGMQKLSSSPRLDALTKLEATKAEKILGTPDRIQEVIACLNNGTKVNITSIELVEPHELLPPTWQQIIELLRGQGTQIAQWQPATPGQRQTAMDGQAPTPTNLTKIQTILQGTTVDEPLSITDDSLILLKAENEWEAAEHLALWLAANIEENHNVAIICGMDSSILDQTFARHNLPKLGRSAPSRWREVQQILPLILANAWTPLDVRRLVELLALSMPPFPAWACRILLKAIAQEPGVGGNAWDDALAKIQETRRLELIDKDATEEDATTKAKAFVQEIQFLLVDNRFDPKVGIPEDRLKALCQKVIDMLGWQLKMDSRLASVIGHAREMQALALGKGNIPRTTLERMIDTVIGVGSTSEDSLEEAGSWHVVDQPGQLVDSWETVIWWGFNDNTVGPATYWSETERTELTAAGIHLEESSIQRSRDAYSWQQGFMQAQGRFLGIALSQVDGEEAYHHPYWDAIWCAATQAAGCTTEQEVEAAIFRESKNLENKQDWAFAGRQHPMQEVTKEEPAKAEQQCNIPAGLINPPKRLSYSQMSTLIGCPMKWALEYHANLRLPESQNVPTGNKMIGTLCHRIVEELYAQTDRLDADLASKAAEDLYDRLLPSMASELLLDGNTVERQRYRTSVATAVNKLVKAINQRQLRVEKTEASLESIFNGIPFIGYADMLLRDEDGHPYVLDLKWSYTDKHHKQSVELGNALQLATYAWMIKSAVPSEQAVTGYFMLAQGKLLSDSAELIDEPIPAPHDLERTWEMGAAAFVNTMDQLSQGLIEVRGVQEMIAAQEAGSTEEKIKEQRLIHGRDAGILYQEPLCRFCDFGGICGKIGGVV